MSLRFILSIVQNSLGSIYNLAFLSLFEALVYAFWGFLQVLFGLKSCKKLKSLVRIFSIFCVIYSQIAFKNTVYHLTRKVVQ